MVKSNIDYKGNPVQIGDSVLFAGLTTLDSRRTGLRDGIIIGIIYNPFDREQVGPPMYEVLDLKAANAKPAICQPKDILHTGSDYQGMSIDYIRALHTKQGN